MSSGPKRIFIVEDQRLIAADLENTLSKLGYQIVGTAATGEEAIRRTDETRPDLVLMDIRLRGELDGIQAATSIRQRADIPIVYLTAYADEETILRAKVTSPFGYVVKPINQRELRAAIEIALYKHDTERALAEEIARRQTAEESVQARDEFLQIAAHELKTPMTSLRLHLDTLSHALKKSGTQDERLHARVATAMRQTARLSRLIENLLDVSRITGGRLVLEFEEFDLVHMAEEVVDRFQVEATKARCTLEVRQQRPLVGRWDRLRLEQVVSNLLSNAIKYGAGMPIHVEIGEGGRGALLSVRDGGIGINEEALERIFGRFERAVSLHHFGGLGLGLFIARQIAEAHGGTIGVRSQPGDGATFTVTLPREPPPKESAAGGVQGGVAPERHR